MGWQADYETAQRTKTANVICMKWGTLYGPEWVNKLYGMVARNTTWNIRFVCLTDNAAGIRREVECLPLPRLDLDNPAMFASRGRDDPWWNKMGAFQERVHDLSGMTLYLDLDVVIVGSIDDFFTHRARFCMMQVWRAERYQSAIGNSSVVRFFVGAEKNVFEKFASEPLTVWEKKYGGSQQRFLSESVSELTFFPKEWCVSFKDCLPRNALLQFWSEPKLPAHAKIIVFYGAYTPLAAMRGEKAPVKKRAGVKRARLELFRRRFRAPPWIAEKWAE